MNEDRLAAHALGGILTSTLFHAYEEPMGPRRFLYVWERDGLRWLLRFRRRDPDGSVGNDWMATFLALNEAAIEDDHGLMDFNLRAFSERAKSPSRP